MASRQQPSKGGARLLSLTIGPRGRRGFRTSIEIPFSKRSKYPPRGASALPAEIILIFWRKEFFCFLFLYFFYLGLFFEIIHEPLSLEEGTMAEDDSLQVQAYLVLDRREEVRQAP